MGHQRRSSNAMPQWKNNFRFSLPHRLNEIRLSGDSELQRQKAFGAFAADGLCGRQEISGQLFGYSPG